jgi:hypothetical protein
MTSSTPTLKSNQRQRVLDAYRGRGRRTNSLWLVYSIKTERDWILSSDRQLVHWLVFLEANPLVRTFSRIEDSAAKPSEGPVTVITASGEIEIHRIKAISNQTDINADIQPNDIGTPNEPTTRVFTDSELLPVVKLAMRWHKALSFAAAMRGNEHTALRLAVVQYISNRKNGSVGRFVSALSDFEECLSIGMLVRLAVEGRVYLDLQKSSFSYNTLWSLSEGNSDVF